MAAFLFSSCVCVGAVLVALGPSLTPTISNSSAYWVMFTGRLIFG